MFKTSELKKNFIRWSIVCTICAAPSFVIAYDGFNHMAMILGVIIFICLYTLLNSTETFYRITDAKPNLKKSLKFGYGLKFFQGIIGLSLTFIMSGGKLVKSPVLFFPDFYAGMFSIAFLQKICGMEILQQTHEDRRPSPEPTFSETLAMTLTEGVILSLMILLVCMVVWAILAIYSKFKTKKESKNA